MACMNCLVHADDEVLMAGPRHDYTEIGREIGAAHSPANRQQACQQAQLS